MEYLHNVLQYQLRTLVVTKHTRWRFSVHVTACWCAFPLVCPAFPFADVDTHVYVFNFPFPFLYVAALIEHLHSTFFPDTKHSCFNTPILRNQLSAFMSLIYSGVQPVDSLFFSFSYVEMIHFPEVD